MMVSTLLLNADATPVSLIPLSALTWQQAIAFQWSGDAEPLHLYDNWVVHSPSLSMPVPAVVILKQQVSVRRNFKGEGGGPSPRLVYLRDGYTCQYCGEVFPRNQLTQDHVLPRKFGGKTAWNNIVSACSPCNGRRGHDVRIQPMSKPVRPTYQHLVKMMKRFPITIPHPTWNWYLGWNETRVQVVEPRENRPGGIDGFTLFDAA